MEEQKRLAVNAYRNSIKMAESYADTWFADFLSDYNLKYLVKDVFQEQFDYYIKKSDEKRKENGFYGDYFKVRVEWIETGILPSIDNDLFQSIFAYKFNNNLDWNRVADEVAVSIAFARMIEKLNEWKINNFPVPNLPEEIQKPVKIKKITSNPPASELTLGELFKSPADYITIKRLLSEREYINATHDTWLYGGKSKKSYLLGLIKILTDQGYFKQGVITTKDKIAVIKNSFQISVSESTVTNDLSVKYIREYKEFIKKKV